MMQSYESNVLNVSNCLLLNNIENFMSNLDEKKSVDELYPEKKPMTEGRNPPPKSHTKPLMPPSSPPPTLKEDKK